MEAPRDRIIEESANAQLNPLHHLTESPTPENKQLYSQSLSSLTHPPKPSNKLRSHSTHPKAEVHRSPSESAHLSGTRSVTEECASKGKVCPRSATQQIRSGLLVTQLTRLKISSKSGRSSQTVKTLAEVAQFIRNGHARNIAVVAGAGISTASGIPDFRSPGTGLYDNLKQYKIPFAEAIFDLDYFRKNPHPFFTLAKELYPSEKYLPNLVHYFLLLLHNKGLLRRIYTQNIDGLERMCGIPAEKLVEAHGSFSSAACADCQHPHSASDVKLTILAGKIPLCVKPKCKGFVKPGIVFFGEDLPQSFYRHRKDLQHADLLFVMGTSLQVRPFADIVSAVRFDVPRVLFNLKPVGPFKQTSRRINDVTATGDIVGRITEFVDMLGWKEDLEKLMSESQLHVVMPKHLSTASSDVSLPACIKAQPCACDQETVKHQTLYNDMYHDSAKQHKLVLPPISVPLDNSQDQAQHRLNNELDSLSSASTSSSSSSLSSSSSQASTPSS